MALGGCVPYTKTGNDFLHGASQVWHANYMYSSVIHSLPCAMCHLPFIISSFHLRHSYRLISWVVSDRIGQSIGKRHVLAEHCSAPQATLTHSLTPRHVIDRLSFHNHTATWSLRVARNLVYTPDTVQAEAPSS
jgi:hypothetical protein